MFETDEMAGPLIQQATENIVISACLGGPGHIHISTKAVQREGK